MHFSWDALATLQVRSVVMDKRRRWMGWD